MNFIVLDLEWNQAYQELAIAVQKRLAARLRGEVIQIGAVKIDEKGTPCGSYSITVRPKYYRKILRHVAKLTGITQERADRGVSLPEAAAAFHRFCGEDFAFLTWGPDDIPMLKDNFRVHSLDTTWLDNSYDLQQIFNCQTVGGKNQKSLEFAMEYFGIPQNLPAHDALNDAYFTALVAAKLDIVKGIRELPEQTDDGILSLELGNADIGDDGYVEQKEILADCDRRFATCPVCGAKTKAEKWLHSRGQRYTLPILCEEHGQMLVTLKLLHNFNDTFRGVVRVKAATPEAMEKYRAGYEAAHSQRRYAHRRGHGKTTAKAERPEG